MLTLLSTPLIASLAAPLTTTLSTTVATVQNAAPMQLTGVTLHATRQAVLTRLPLDVSITPNSKLPGTAQLNTLIGGLVTWVLLACVGAVLLGAAAWGIGSRSGYYGAQQNGRMMVLGGAVGAMVAGAAAALVNYGFGIGSSVQ